MSEINKDAANEQLINQKLSQVEDKENNNQGLNQNLTTPGRLLRAGREQKELAISTVGKQLKLDSRVIEALERDDFDSIGAPVFVKGHLRKYASYVGVNPDDVMLSYYQVARAKDATPVISQTMPMTDSRPKFAWVGKLLTGLVTLALVAALIYAIYRGWNWYLADAESSSLDGVVNVQDSSLNLPSRDDVQIATTNTNPESNVNVTGSVAGTNDQTTTQILTPPQQNSLANAGTVVNTNAFVSNTSDESQAVNVTSDSQSSDTSSSTNSSNVSIAANNVQAAAGDTLRLLFVENCWVNIKGENGRSLMNGIGYQNDSREFVLTGNTEIHLGNADGVELFLNGQPYVVPRRARSGKTAHFELVPRQ